MSCHHGVDLASKFKLDKQVVSGTLVEAMPRRVRLFWQQ